AFGKTIPSIQKALDDMNVNEIINQIQVDGEIMLNTDSGDLTLKQEHILIETSSAEGLITAQDEEYTVALSTVLNDELIQEGLVRDLIRQVQIMRKNADFAVENRIKVYGEFNDKLVEALNAYKDYFCNETLTVSIEPSGAEIEYSETIKIQGEKITLGISRTKKN
ncbi:MAG: DUF5915 domain-containing protein, partial [Candidatus Neomarinimicrobiota bacterium]